MKQEQKYKSLMFIIKYGGKEKYISSSLYKYKYFSLLTNNNRRLLNVRTPAMMAVRSGPVL